VKRPAGLARPLGNAVVLGFLALQLGLGLRSLLLEDARLGWGMFCYQTNYTVAYEWVLADGTTLPFPARDLGGRSLKYLADDYAHRTRYGRGAIRGWMESYLGYLLARYRPGAAVGARAVVTYRINKLGEWRTLVVQVPVVAS